MNFTVPDAAVVAVATAILGGIGTAMKLMWDALKSDHAAVRADNKDLQARLDVQEKRSDECEQDRKELHKEIGGLKRGINAALACTNADCQVRKRLSETFALKSEETFSITFRRE